MRVIWSMIFAYVAVQGWPTYANYYEAEINDCERVFDQPFGHLDSENGNYENFARMCWLIKPSGAETVRIYTARLYIGGLSLRARPCH